MKTRQILKNSLLMEDYSVDRYKQLMCRAFLIRSVVLVSIKKIFCETSMNVLLQKEIISTG